jgi:hypothetical protein
MLAGARHSANILDSGIGADRLVAAAELLAASGFYRFRGGALRRWPRGFDCCLHHVAIFAALEAVPDGRVAKINLPPFGSSIAQANDLGTKPLRDLPLAMPSTGSSAAIAVPAVMGWRDCELDIGAALPSASQIACPVSALTARAGRASRGYVGATIAIASATRRTVPIDKSSS